eukprot:5879586-Prymnesium_polylepis.1
MGKGGGAGEEESGTSRVAMLARRVAVTRRMAVTRRAGQEGRAAPVGRETVIAVRSWLRCVTVRVGGEMARERGDGMRRGRGFWLRTRAGEYGWCMPSRADDRDVGLRCVHRASKHA